MFLGCLLVLALACVGLALVPTSTYWLLLLLRCLQAAGSASTIALGNQTHPCLETTDVGLPTQVPVLLATYQPLMNEAVFLACSLWDQRY